ncbi:MAG: NAD(P)H-hydrate dehydratase, partial [Acidobacteria bacterium]|nr:NAD(P)H-hydrate dehydratase [Acidobacteriota bacterium]
GTGISKPLDGFLLFIAQSINALGLPVVSVDVPSGLLSDDVATASLCVQATLTVTFTAPKIGMVLGPNASAVGEMVVASIGSPPELVEQSGSPFSLMTRDLLAPFQKGRPPFSHKGDFGKILIVSGSRGKSGAAILAGHAALRSGAGLVTLAVPSTIQDAVMAAAPPELMTAGLASTAQGALAPSAGKQILRLLEDFDVVAIGPGLGTGSGAVSAVWEVVSNSSVPVVADADAVNALALLKHPWKSISPLVLTPHLGEMGRLVNRSAPQVFAERLALAADFPRRHDCYLVLKGFRSMVSDPRGEVWVNSTGNPGMATAGSGDALTGIIAAFVARTLHQMDPSLHDAVAAAVYLHGAAGDAAMSQLGQESLMAGDIIRFLPEVLKFPRA